MSNDTEQKTQTLSDTTVDNGSVNVNVGSYKIQSGEDAILEVTDSKISLSTKSEIEVEFESAIETAAEVAIEPQDIITVNKANSMIMDASLGLTEFDGDVQINDGLNLPGKMTIPNFKTFVGGETPVFGQFTTDSDQFGYIYLNKARMYGSDMAGGMSNDQSDVTDYEGMDVFLYPDQTIDNDGNSFAMALKIAGYVNAKGKEKQIALIATNKLIGHDNLHCNGFNALSPTDPWYYASRLFRVLPKQLKDIRMSLDSDQFSTISSTYMAGTIALATNFFTKSEEDSEQDGFITPIIFDEDSNDVTSARALGVPFIPADKKSSLPKTANIAIGTQSFDLTSKKPCWWNGEAWCDAMGNVLN